LAICHLALYGPHMLLMRLFACLLMVFMSVAIFAAFGRCWECPRPSDGVHDNIVVYPDRTAC